MKIINPATEELIQELEHDRTNNLEKKFNALRHGLKSWRKTPLEERIRCIKRYHELLGIHKEDLAKTMTMEMGKPISEARGEIEGARGRIQYFIDHSAEWLRPKLVNDDGTTKEVLSFEPLGVIANISAWNYPFLVGVNVQIPALIAGNTVLYKPSEFTTITGLKMQELFYEAGIPQDAFITAVGEGDVGKAILDLPIDGLFFTGSYPTGKAIYEALAPRLIPVGLELGGKDPLYVADDVTNVSKAAADAVGGAFYNNGQSCCAVERIYVHENIYDEFLEEFVSYVKSLKVGDPMDDSTNQGSLARPQHIAFLEDQVKDAVAKGARLLAGGKRVEGKGAFFEPTVLADTTHDMKVMKDESFGPIIGIQKVSSDEEAIEKMDDTEFGLTAAVFTSNQIRADHILDELEVGNAYQNCSDRVSPHLPWAGQRNSGVGSTLSYLGILAFVRPKGRHYR